MSFRLRVLLLVVFLVTTSTAATAWLTVRQASRQFTDGIAASQREIADAASDLALYGQTHGTWTGVEKPVGQLAAQLGQRVRLVTETGAVLADSDLLSGQSERPVVGAPAVVDPRPALPPLTASNVDDRYRQAVAAVDQYYRGWLFAQCLTSAGIAVSKTSDSAGLPVFEAIGAKPAGIQKCKQQADQSPRDVGAVAQRGRQCSAQDNAACLQELFAEQISRLAPPQLRLYVGARDELPRTLSSESIILAASAVVVAATLSALLLTRRVVRPVTALTAASRRLGSGNLSERVPVTGSDEFAELGREFNRMAESLAQSEERQRRLVADVAHELRTPLANLRGYIEALSDGVLAPSPELFASLHEETLLQQRIVDDLQELALAEAGALAYHKSAVDLAELAETCRTTHAALAHAAGIALQVDIRTPARVHADPDRLRQMAGNLIRNAIAATPTGGTVRLMVDRQHSSVGPQALIQISDTGRGIAETDLPHIFDRFWRADGARQRNTGGHGLGLAIARQLVAGHHGTIEVTSRVGAGTVFTVTLPAE